MINLKNNRFLYSNMRFRKRDVLERGEKQARYEYEGNINPKIEPLPKITRWITNIGDSILGVAYVGTLLGVLGCSIYDSCYHPLPQPKLEQIAPFEYKSPEKKSRNPPQPQGPLAILLKTNNF